VALENLVATESGLGLIYSALKLLAAHYELDDVVVVLESHRGSASTQIFRLHGKVIDGDFVVRFGDIPGLYSPLVTVSLEDRDAIMEACERALSHHQARIVASQEIGDESDSLSPVRESRPEAIFSSARSKRSVAPSTSQSERLSYRHRVFLSRVLTLVDLANLAMTVFGTHGPVRFTLGLILGLFIPGWSVVGFLNLRNAALEFALSMASSLAIILIAAQSMTLINFWHLGAFEDFVCCACLIPLVRLSGYRMQRTKGVR
jgi:hypothetical protein